jgi:hypothetical protein
LVAKVELDTRPQNRKILRKQITTSGRLTVRSNRVDLFLAVPTGDDSVRATATRPTDDHDDVASSNGPFALDSEQSRPEVEDQVVPLVTERPRHAHAMGQGLECDRLFGEGAFLICRQHWQQCTRDSGRFVAR